MRSKPLPCPGPECGLPVVAFGLCESHREQQRHGKILRPLGRQRGPRPATSAFLAEVVKEARSGRPLAQQAAALSITTSHLQVLRTLARKAGHDFPRGMPGVRNWESPRWRELDERKARCPVCRLRLPHECTGSATDYMRSGRPAGGDSMWSQGGE